MSMIAVDDRTDPAPSPARSPLLRCYTSDDWLMVVRRLTPVLANSYPGGAQWLARRLDDVEGGRARAHVLDVSGDLGGIAVETPKPGNRIKLSTLWLEPDLRGRGHGRELLEACTTRWRADGVPLAWITAGGAAVHSVQALITRHGFKLTARELNRYGPGRDEWVFHWTP